MVSSQLLCFIFFCLLAGFATSSTFISGGVFESHGSTGRGLLQVKKACHANFEYANYTIITSKCKGPKYEPKLCCGAFKEFACPYAEAINDATTDCANTMFSYINLYGKYPPGLFANECREGKEGLACPANATAPASDKSNGGRALAHSTHAVAVSAVVVYLFRWF